MPRSQRTVLIIDDEPADRLTYRRYLATDPLYEYMVLEAEHGAQALALCQTHRPACLILDYRLPGEDGLALLQRLTAAAHPYLYPVVMLTGVENTAIAVQAMQSGVHDYLSKNQVTPTQLQRAVRNAMEKVALQDALAQQREWFRVALTSIGDAVIATDTSGHITFLNPVAEMLTGWTFVEAQGQPMTQVFHIINEETHRLVENPVDRVLQTGVIVGLANHTLLIAKDGREIPIDDSAAPIRDQQGNLIGVVLVFRDISERRHTESQITALNRQLNERVQELQTLLEVSPIGISLATDPECRQVWTNPVLRNLLRLPPDANASLTPAATELPAYRVYRNGQEVAPAEMPMQYAARHGVPVRNVELEVIHPDGAHYTLLKSAEPLFDEGGQVRGCVAFNVDITARKQAEEELRNARNFIQQITDVMPDALYVYDIVNHLSLYVNQKGVALLGHPTAGVQPPGSNFVQRAMHPEDQAAFRQHSLALRDLPDDAVAEFEYRMRTVDDTWRWFRSRDKAYRRDADNQVVEIIGTASDVTNRKNAEEALRNSEERFRLAIEAAQMGFWEWDIGNNQVTWGGHLEQLLGLQPGEFAGTYGAFLALVHPEDQPMIEAMVAETLATGAPYGKPFRAIRPDGEVRWLNGVGRLYRDADGRPRRLLGTIQDITPLKQAEEVLQAINATLAARVHERTLALAESKRQLEHFVTIATRDLRDTLRGIDHLTSWLNEDAAHLLPTTSQRHLTTLRNRVRRLENQLEDLLTYAQAGHQEDALRRVDLHALLQEIAQELEAPPAFRFVVDFPLPVLVTQHSALETVLRHLLDNAVKHHHQPAQGQVYITNKQTDEWIEFTLTDDGPGIAPHQHGLIFEMFHTLQPRDRAKGNGVGLAIAKKIVESWGGSITVESAAGQGATFRFTWPLTPSP
jgi:PAS domain S-box-containing protein